MRLDDGRVSDVADEGVQLLRRDIRHSLVVVDDKARAMAVATAGRVPVAGSGSVFLCARDVWRERRCGGRGHGGRGGRGERGDGGDDERDEQCEKRHCISFREWVKVTPGRGGHIARHVVSRANAWALLRVSDHLSE